MAQYANLIATITAAIRTNGVGAITGQLLQTILHGMVNSLGLNYQYAGIATPSTNPGAPDQRVLYLATQAGTYEHFGGAVLDGVTVHIFTYDGTWHDATMAVATKAELAAYLQIADLASGTGQSTTTTMTQKAITDALLGLAQSIESHIAKLPELTVGSSAGVLGRTVDAAFLFRRTAGTAKIGRGAAALMAILGNTEVSDGHLISNDAAAIKTVGFNKWDEEWERGAIDTTTGQNVPNTGYIRTKNYIKVIPGSHMYLRYPNGTTGPFVLYDAAKNYIGVIGSGSTLNKIVQIPDNCCYIRSNFDGTTYNHDICINLSDPAKNGTYEPYWERIIQLGLSTRTGKLNGQGASVVVFPDGMNGVGTNRDAIRADGKTADKMRARIDLGSLDYSYEPITQRFYVGLSPAAAPAKVSDVANIISPLYEAVSFSVLYSSHPNMSMALSTAGSLSICNNAYTDPAAFKAAMNGVYLDYPLATTETYILDEPLQMSYKVENGGTEQAVAPDGATLPSAPFIAQIQYPLDVIAMQGDSLADMLDAMVAAGVITSYTMTYNVAAQKYEFTINGMSRNLPENNRKGGGNDEPNGPDNDGPINEPIDEPTDDPGSEDPIDENPGGDIQEKQDADAVRKK